eukprot:COSAG06_NODE_649_length_13411_cov_129.656477_8_plen_42_part_00
MAMQAVIALDDDTELYIVPGSHCDSRDPLGACSPSYTYCTG